jgi:hypothetical protein
VPKQKRKAPSDLSGLTDEQKVERRKEQAREYSKRARQRGSEMKTEMAKEVMALGFARDVFEKAPHVCLVLSGDVRHTTILYANEATKAVLHIEPETLLGRCVCACMLMWNLDTDGRGSFAWWLVRRMRGRCLRIGHVTDERTPLS